MVNAADFAMALMDIIKLLCQEPPNLLDFGGGA